MKYMLLLVLLGGRRSRAQLRPSRANDHLKKIKGKVSFRLFMLYNYFNLILKDWDSDFNLILKTWDINTIKKNLSLN